LLLIIGAFAAVLWANLDVASYDAIAKPLHFAVNDVGMVFFFALVAKEVFEATLPGGSLASVRRAAAPLAAAVGGMAAPAAIYIGLVFAFDRRELASGWAIPCATDIAFSAMVARAVFPKGHPAIPFLLLLAIADDALGLVILAVFYPTRELSFAWLVTLLPAALLFAWLLRRRNVKSFWPYVLGPGAAAWAALYLSGFHPALALAPVVPFMPHAARDVGLFAPGENAGSDTLNRFEHWWQRPVQVVLLLFGFANAGLPLSKVGAGTWIVLAALLIGKPLGILLFTNLARVGGIRIPDGISLRDLMLLGVTASIGFTVSLFFATAAFADGPALAQTKMGALLSLVAAPLAMAIHFLTGRSARISDR
jgi:Na+:H+ antiporter, NhaA family